jgi:hypothetical protein
MLTRDENQRIENGSFKTMVLIFALAASFLIWGFFLFYMIGDKGPPPWDFGIIQDIPGESVYSTQRSLSGRTSEPEPQHVSQKPRALGEGEKAKGEK